MEGKESVIRRMTRLAVQHGAVNLSQGFPDEPPPPVLVSGALAAMLGGTDEGMARLFATASDGLTESGEPGAPLVPSLMRLQSPRDQYNQYSFPFGLSELRVAIARYTERLYGFRPDPDTEITVSLGATEGLASAFGSLCQPGDTVIVPQPFHESYPSQARIFGLKTAYVTIHERADAGRWFLDLDALERVARDGARVLVLNSPHNPSGKVFDEEELRAIAELCIRHDLLAVTDEIYEHIVYGGRRHRCLASLPGMRERTVVVNSISKTGNATGWRVGWVIAVPDLTRRIRGVHDSLVIQAPTPFQKAAIGLLTESPAFFDRLRQNYEAKRALLVGALRDVGFAVTPPEGAYYLFADYRGVAAIRDLAPMDAAMRLIETIGVAPVPGDNFYAEGAYGDRYLRFAFCKSLATLEEGARRLRTM